MKGIIWCQRWRFFLLQCTPALCCFSVKLHNVSHLGWHGPLARLLPLNPPLRGSLVRIRGLTWSQNFGICTSLSSTHGCRCKMQIKQRQGREFITQQTLYLERTSSAYRNLLTVWYSQWQWRVLQSSPWDFSNLFSGSAKLVNKLIYKYDKPRPDCHITSV